MAISRWISAIHQPRGGWRYKVLSNTINYILNPDKTDGGLLTGAFNCSLDHALDDMVDTKRAYGKISDNSSDRLGYHFLISFSPDEDISDETVYQIVREFVKRWVGDTYECVFGIHNDKGHKHGHICLNSVNIQTGRKFRYEDGDWADYIQPLLDEICKEYGAHTLKMDTGLSPQEWEQSQIQGKRKARKRRRACERGIAGRNEYYKEESTAFNKNDLIRFDIDDIILRVSTYEDFIKELQSRGYKTKFGKSGDTLAVLPVGYPKYRRTYSLGKEYTVDMIKKRIQAYNKPLPVFSDSSIRLAVPYAFLRSNNHGLRKTSYNNALKMYYARLYRLGVKPRFSQSNYFDCKQRLSEIRSYQQKIYIVGSNNAFSPESTEKALNEHDSRIKQLDEMLKEAYEERMPYKQMIVDYNKWRKLIKISAPSAEQMLLRDDLERKLRKYPFSMEEIGRFIANNNKKIRGLKKQKRELIKVISVLREVSEMYDASSVPYHDDYNAYERLVREQEKSQNKKHI